MNWLGRAFAAAWLSAGLAAAEPTGFRLDEDAVRKDEPHYLGNFDDASLELFQKSKAAEARRDYLSALQLMQRAADHLRRQRLYGFELWDNLASLYCKQAQRETDAWRAEASRTAGRAMLKEFRRAVDIWTNKRQCWVPQVNRERNAATYGPNALGAVPNPATTPLCFQTLCGTGFGVNYEEKLDDHWGVLMEAEPPDGWASWPHEDVKDLPKIEKLCRSPRSAR